MTTKDLQGALTAIKPFVPRNPTLPILANVKLEHDGETVTVTGTDLEITVSVPVPTSTPHFDAVTVPLVKLTKVVDALAKDGQETVEVQTDGTALTIIASDTEAELRGLSVEEFPDAVQCNHEIALFRADVLEEVQQRIVPHASRDESRLVLTGIAVELTADTATFAAADGFRLGKLTIAHNGRYTGQDHAPLILPRRPLEKLKYRGKGAIVADANETVTLATGDNCVALRFESGATVTVRTIDGNFPNYEQIIPKSNPACLTVGSADYGRALSFVAPFAKEAAGITRHEPNGRLTISATDPDSGTVQRHIDAELNADAEFEWPAFAIDNDYAQAMLKAAAYAGHRKQADAIRISYNTPHAPLVYQAVGDDSYIGVVMPMHTRD